MEDGGRSIEVCCHKLASNHLKLLVLRVPVLSVEEKSKLKTFSGMTYATILAKPQLKSSTTAPMPNGPIWD